MHTRLFAPRQVRSRAAAPFQPAIVPSARGRVESSTNVDSACVELQQPGWHKECSASGPFLSCTITYARDQP